MNTDTNTCWYILVEHELYGVTAREMLTDAVVHSGVMEELLYEIYWSKITKGTSLNEKDLLRDTVVRAIQDMYRKGLLGGETQSLITFALDIFRYRRLDWVDAYLISRCILLNEPFSTFDSEMLRVTNMIRSANGRIPVISGYTLPVDYLPAHVFIKDEDQKSFRRAGLLQLDKMQ